MNKQMCDRHDCGHTIVLWDASDYRATEVE